MSMDDSNGGHGRQRAKIRRGRRMLLLIVLVFAIPLLAAVWLQRYALQEGVWGSTNHGELIQPPLALRDFLLPSYQGDVFTLADLKGKWTLLYAAPSPADCDAQCRQMLYYMRQVRLALGKDMNRVQRVLLAPFDAAWLEEVAQEYGGTHIVFDIGGPTSLLQQLAPTSPDPARAGIYLIDPLGNAMMVFAPETDPRDILKDLKKLLKISKVG